MYMWQTRFTYDWYMITCPDRAVLKPPPLSLWRQRALRRSKVILVLAWSCALWLFGVCCQERRQAGGGPNCPAATQQTYKRAEALQTSPPHCGTQRCVVSDSVHCRCQKYLTSILNIATAFCEAKTCMTSTQMLSKRPQEFFSEQNWLFKCGSRCMGHTSHLQKCTNENIIAFIRSN